jgi:hypothetical protein
MGTSLGPKVPHTLRCIECFSTKRQTEYEARVRYKYMDEEHSDEYMDDSIHEQSECYTCKQYECNEYVRSALARSKVTI